MLPLSVDEVRLRPPTGIDNGGRGVVTDLDRLIGRKMPLLMIVHWMNTIDGNTSIEEERKKSYCRFVSDDDFVMASLSLILSSLSLRDDGESVGVWSRVIGGVVGAGIESVSSIVTRDDDEQYGE